MLLAAPISISLLLPACIEREGTAQTRQTEVPVTSTPVTMLVTPASGITPVSIKALEVTPTATVGVLEAAATPGWVSYTNADYSFSFRYPAGWSIQGAPNLLQLSRQEYTLVIGYRWNTESIRLGPGNLPAGDFVTKNSVNFLNLEVQREVLMSDNKTKAVFYTLPQSFEIALGPEQGLVSAQGGLVFAVRLQSFDSDYLKIDIPDNVQKEADQIMASFELINP